MHVRRLLLSLPLLAAILLTPGCDQPLPSFGAETDNSDYNHGKELLKQGQTQPALDAFLKVIAERGDDNAPESHLEAGLLYHHELHDPVEAIHHYRRYRALKPTGPQADLVRQQIEDAQREFLRTQPGQGENQSPDLLATVDRLQRENKLLHDQLAGLGLNPAPAATKAGSPIVPVSAAPTGNRAGVPSATPIIRTGTAPTPPPAPVATGRTHTVASGDTLSSLAQKYYGNRSKWHDILNANSDQLPNEKSPLHPGMVLKIP